MREISLVLSAARAGQDQRGAGAQIGRHHRRPGELSDPLDGGAVPLDDDVGAEAQQFGDVHEAVLEDILADHAGAVGQTHQGHELGLHVGRESRDRGGS